MLLAAANCALLLWTGLIFEIVQAGEIVLYLNDNACGDNNPGFSFIFSASQTSDCLLAPELEDTPSTYALANRRVIAPYCTFHAYTDTDCKHLAVTLHSDGTSAKCHPVKGGIGSLKVTCTPSSPIPQADNQAMDLDTFAAGSRMQRYIQAADMYRSPGTPDYNSPYGGRDIYVEFVLDGASKPNVPTGNFAAAGVALTREFYEQVPSAGDVFSVTGSVPGSSVFTIEVTARGGITAARAVALIGPPSFASMMADTMAALAREPTTWIAYGVYDPNTEIAIFNMTYT